MHARTLLLPLGALAATALLSCVDATRPSATADVIADLGACQPPDCASWEDAVDEDDDGCMDACQPRSCSDSCDCEQPSQEDSKSLCPSEGWPGFGLFAECVDKTCAGVCGAIPTAVLNCAGGDKCPADGADCDPWEETFIDPLTGCVDDCEVRCELDCDCYVALHNPDGTCDSLQRSIWTCTDQHRCATSCVSLAHVPDCQGDRADECNASKDCGDGGLDKRNYCARPPGMCGDDGTGLCTLANRHLDSCPETGPAVCGCDDHIYPNLCRAIASGVSVQGPAAMCPQPVTN